MDLPFKCSHDGCSKAFRRRDRLEIHSRTHTGERPFTCSVPGCQSSYARSQHLSRHIERVHSLKYKLKQKEICPHCQDAFADSLSLKKHIQSFHTNTYQVKLYQCSQEGCDESFHKKQQLVMHRLQHDDTLIKAPKCYRCPHEGCDKEFVFPGRLKRHIKIHQGYHCDFDGCNEVLPNWSKLRKHKATVHCPTFKCNSCGIEFKRKPSLTQHLKVHSEDFQPISCTWAGCKRTFQYPKNLRQHIRSFHKGEEVFKKRSDSKSKPRKERKKISHAAFIFGLDDRGKNASSSMDHETGDTCSRLQSLNTDLEAIVFSKPTDDVSDLAKLVPPLGDDEIEDCSKNAIDSTFIPEETDTFEISTLIRDVISQGIF